MLLVTQKCQMTNNRVFSNIIRYAARERIKINLTSKPSRLAIDIANLSGMAQSDIRTVTVFRCTTKSKEQLVTILAHELGHILDSDTNPITKEYNASLLAFHNSKIQLSHVQSDLIFNAEYRAWIRGIKLMGHMKMKDFSHVLDECVRCLGVYNRRLLLRVEGPRQTKSKRKSGSYLNLSKGVL